MKRIRTVLWRYLPTARSPRSKNLQRSNTSTSIANRIPPPCFQKAFFRSSCRFQWHASYLKAYFLWTWAWEAWYFFPLATICLPNFYRGCKIFVVQSFPVIRGRCVAEWWLYSGAPRKFGRPHGFFAIFLYAEGHVIIGKSVGTRKIKGAVPIFLH